ncbi:MAG: D-glycero-alpha-D-manno-heptose-7-phosphate kinase [Acidobacteriota bacterium]|nr:D-glycero-alpha-D-manno-heptose-7-phosphate kinase [Acidobacteriota bacterium]
MGLPTGVQDHYPALLGGALEILHQPGGEEVRRIDADLDALAASLLVVYSGQSHFSAGKNWQVVRRRLDGEAEITRLFAGLAEVAAEAGTALEAGDLPRLGVLLGREWGYRRQLAEGISTPVLEDLLAAALAAGAWGGKACGAGGGGCLAVLCPPGRRAEVREQLEKAGGVVLDARPTAEPLSVLGGGAVI